MLKSGESQLARRWANQGGGGMDADEAAMVFVEICSRLDALVDAQQKTNELLTALQSALREHSEVIQHDVGDAHIAPPAQHRTGNLQRGLGNLMPSGDETVRLTAVPTP
jgi:hypothetical protein